MPTIREILTAAIPRLKRAGIDSPKLDAELLLARVLQRSRSWLWAHYNDLIPAEPVATFSELLERRECREPAAYLLGEWEFYGRSFSVTPAVLVPRPETEMLVEAVLRWARETCPQRIADIGTGSGIIAVTLAAEMPELQLFAVDLSPEALDIARQNAARHGVGERVTFLEGNLLLPLHEADIASLDAVVANLPYIAEELMEGLMPEIRLFEPSLALRGGDDGLSLINRLIDDSPDLLRADGLLALEIGDGQADIVITRLATAGWAIRRTVVDYGGITRDILAVHR